MTIVSLQWATHRIDLPPGACVDADDGSYTTVTVVVPPEVADAFDAARRGKKEYKAQDHAGNLYRAERGVAFRKQTDAGDQLEFRLYIRDRL